jgi:peptidyl-prolyl cis-trans isomerase D
VKLCLFRYLSVPTSAFNNDSITISENDIKKYYQNNKSDFKIEEKRKLSYVLFSTDPSPADTARVYRLIEDILLDLKNGADFAQLADEYSEDPSVRNNHGDLGYFEHGRMIKAFSDAAFNAKPGDLVGPVSTRFGLHIIKVHDKKIENGEEQVHASHILLKVNPSALTMENAQSDASEFAEEAKDEGFDVSADKKKYEIKKTADFTNNNYIPGFGPTTVAVQWAFNADLDDISEVIRTSQGYVVFKLESISPAGFRSLEDVKSICKSRIRRDRQKDLAKQVAINIQEQLNNNKTFTDIINNDTSSKIKMDSTNNFTMQRNDPKIGNAPEVTAAAFTLDIEQKSDILESDRGYFIIKVIERDSFNEEDYKNQRIRIRDQLLSQKAQQFFNSWYEKLKEKADIDDNRNLFFSS